MSRSSSVASDWSGTVPKNRLMVRVPNLVSPGACLAAAMIGYYSLAGFSNAFITEGSLGGILIRILLTLQLMFMVFLNAKYLSGGAVVYLLPGVCFFFVYLLRLVENIFLSGVIVEPGPETVFLIYLGSTIIPSLVLAVFATQARVQDFVSAMYIFAVLFLLGLALNLGELVATVDTRLSLERANPIQLAYTSISILLLFYFTLERRFKVSTILALLAVPFLVLVVLYSQSRGPLVSSALALLIYLLLLRGSSRFATLSYLAIIGGVLFVWNSELVTTTIVGMIERSNIYDQSTYMHMIASEGAWAQFWEDPLVGRYVIELQTQFYPHNIYVESLMAVGVLGALPFALHMLLAIRAAFGLLRVRNPTVVSTLAVLLFIRECFAAGISGGLWGSSMFWALSFFVIGLWYGQSKLARRTAVLNMRAA
jgi:hypothetical protein